MSYLKNHPFPVEAHFEKSVVLSFAIPKDLLIPFIPECLSLDCFQNKWAFIALAMVNTNHLRPKGFPKFFGNNFFLTGYRIFVQYKNNQGKRFRGLYILKSETDKSLMKLFGNIFTHYNYSKRNFNFSKNGEFDIIDSMDDYLKVVYHSHDNAQIPTGSPFNTWKEARRFAGPLPFTFTYRKKDKTVTIIEGVRSNWKPKPIEIQSYQCQYLNELGIEDYVLANAFEIRDIPYYWKKGKTETWN